MPIRSGQDAAFPRRLAAPPGAGGPFECVDGLYALHDRPHSAPTEGAELVLAGGRIAVFRGPLATAPPRSCAVYATPGGTLAVPTGRVLVRLQAGTPAEEKRADLESAGYRIERIAGYAPHAAWVRSADGTIASALNGLARLSALAGVEHVEPEMLMQKHSRKG